MFSSVFPFKDPWMLFLIPAVVVAVFFAVRKKKAPTLRYSSTALLGSIKHNWKVRINKKLVLLKILALILFLIALAGPREVLERTEIMTEGIDIILTVDASGSMAAMDFKLGGKRVDRLAAVKNVIEDFVKGRKGDRIALVVFAEQAFTVCPLTTDYDWLIENLRRIDLGVIEDKGTAIGSSIITSLGRLEGRDAKSKIVILLTDGVSNAGKIDPIKAAQAAKAVGVRIYTIGAGTSGVAPYPVKDLFGRKTLQNMRVQFDGETLSSIAKITEAKYYGVNDTNALRDVYEEIDRLEKTEIEETGYREYKQFFDRFVYAGLAILILGSVLSNTLFMRIP